MHPNFVMFTCRERAVRATYRLGAAGAKLAGGVGGLRTEMMPRQTDAVLWDSHPPYGQEIALFLDGHAEQEDVGRDLHLLYVMARALPGEAWPPTVRLAGNARRTDLPWLIADIDADESSALARPDGALTRIAVTVSLLQDNRPGLAIERAPAKRARARKRAAGKGSKRGVLIGRVEDSVAGLARSNDVSPAALAQANGIRLGARIRDGQRLRLP